MHDRSVEGGSTGGGAGAGLKVTTLAGIVIGFGGSGGFGGSDGAVTSLGFGDSDSGARAIGLSCGKSPSIGV
jgi:hypothetical protein